MQQQRPPNEITTQIVAAALVLGPVVFLVIRFFVPGFPTIDILQMPSMLLGVLLPIVGFWVHRTMIAGVRKHADPDRRAVAFLRSILVPLAITELAAFLGVLAVDPEANPWPLVAVLGHILLAVAIWPSPERFRAWVQPHKD